MREFEALTNVFPTLTSYNVPDHRAMNIIEQGKFSIRKSIGKAAPYCPNTVGVKFGTIDHWTVTPAALINAITHIVLLRSYKQMIGIYARRIVATMQNLLAACKGYPVMHFVRKTVSQLLELARRGKDSVSLVVGSGGPYPASLLLINALPKQLIFGLNKRDGVAFGATKPCAALDLVGLCGKGTIASFAHASDKCSPDSVSASVTTRGFLALSKSALTILARARYCMLSQGVNLRRQVSFWSGPLAAQTACGPSFILTQGEV